MATPKKLPSGQWRTQVYDYTDANGKRHYRSFTADSKKKSAFMAAEFAANKQRIAKGDLTISEALEEYIKTKENILSPSTIRGYRSCVRNYYSKISDLKIRGLTNSEVQEWVNDLARQNKSPKTIANAHGLLMSALDLLAPELKIRTTLPQKQRPELYCPSDEDVKHLLEHVAGRELEIAILLAAFGPMRRGEICALTSDDIHGNIITVNKSMVMTDKGEWVIKAPKTYSSYRDIIFPDFVINRLSGIQGRIIKATPNQLTSRFERAIYYSRSPHFRFHDLRHYAASIMHAIGIPDQYIMQRGGWSTDGVMKSVYRNTIDSETQRMTGKINHHFENITISHEMQHDI